MANCVLLLILSSILIIPIICESQSSYQYYCSILNVDDNTRQTISCTEKEWQNLNDPETNKTNDGVIIIAVIAIRNDINVTGWFMLDGKTYPDVSDHKQAYEIGFLEGETTGWLIKSYRENILGDITELCERHRPILNRTLTSILNRALELHQKDPYWNEVLMLLYQLTGMDDGIAVAENRTHPAPDPDNTRLGPDPCGALMLNLFTELSGLGHLGNLSKIEPEQSRCSAIVKVIPNEQHNGIKDVYVSHATWTSLNDMLRIMRRYNLQYSSSRNNTIIMSSYPASLYSLDDFYITNHHMVVMETTINNFNPSLYKQVNVDDMVYQFIRTMVANRLATSGKEWTELYSRHNGGTYDNQWMIVDYKKFDKENGKLNPGFFWALEQLPGTIIKEDLTEKLMKDTYWPSYNIPYFKEIYQKANYSFFVDKYGEAYSYEKCARALIFARDHHKVTNMTTLYHLMRYNDFKHDPLSRCNCTPPYTASKAIASRNDLNDPNGKYPIRLYAFRGSGATDVKMSNYDMVQNMLFIAESGPTRQDQPAFSWKTTLLPKNISHIDHPETWEFDPIYSKWDDGYGDGSPKVQKFKFDF